LAVESANKNGATRNNRFNQVGNSMKTTITTILCISVLATSLCYAGNGDDIAEMDIENLLDNIVLSASKHEESLEETPSNVFVISRKMIDNYGFMNIGEALSIVPGIYITDDYSLSQTGVRGVALSGDWNSHVLVLLDGRPIQEQYGGTSSIDVPGVNIDNIDRIEVVKGPASSLYGSNAFLGMINLITKAPNESTVSVNARYYSNTGDRETGLNVFHRFNDAVSLHSTVSYRNQMGSELFFPEFSDNNDESLFQLDDDGYNQYYLDSADFTNGIATEGNTVENISTYNQLYWNDFTLTFNYANLNTGIAQSFWGSLFNRPENFYRERHFFTDLEYSSWVTSKMNLMVRLSYNYYRWSNNILYNYYEWEDEPDYLPGAIWKDLEYDKSYSSELKVHINIDEKNMVIIGGETQFHSISHESGETDATGEVITENFIPEEHHKNDGQIYNAYTQYEHSFSEHFVAVGGFHFNYYSYTTGRMMPKGALIFKPNKSSTYKLIASRGFRSPTFYEITYDDHSYYINNPDLNPETITSFELISIQNFPYGISVVLGANYGKIYDLILHTIIDDTDPDYPEDDFYLDEVGQFRNAGEMRSSGLEVSISRNPVYTLSGFFNFTYQDLRILDDEQDDVIFNSPHWLANAGISYHLNRDKLLLSTRINYTSARKLIDYSTLESVVLTDLNLSIRNILGEADITIGVKNVFDKDNFAPIGWDYEPSVKIQRPGRSVFINFRLSSAM
jgi:outer membrane receptor protein involved in Fe transport